MRVSRRWVGESVEDEGQHENSGEENTWTKMRGEEGVELERGRGKLRKEGVWTEG